MRTRRHNLVTMLIVTLLTVVYPWRTLAQTEPDKDTDAYDQTTCSGINEDEMGATKAGAVQNPNGPVDLPGSSSRNGGNDPDGFSPFPNGSFDLPFQLDFGGGSGGSGGGGGGGGGGGAFSFSPTYTNEEDKRVNGSFYPQPEVSISPATPTAVQGQDFVATVQYDSFASQAAAGQDFYTVAFVDGKFINGYMAGGSKEALDQQQLRAADPARPDCGVFSRIPKTDKDHDGMDDDWEVAHGLNPNDPSDAGQDPDHDGYKADSFKNIDGQVVQPAPAIQGATLGDGVFTNYEEYLMGTDPHVADTDGDGVPDEGDAVGLGQTVIKFPATKALGEPAYNVHIIVVGRTGKVNENAVHLVKIDSATKQIQAGTKEKLGVDLSLVSSAPPGGKVVVEALPSGSEQNDLLDTYRWSVDGNLVTESSGQGRRTLEYPVQDGTPIGTNLGVTLDVINFKTGQLAHKAMTVVVGDTVLLNFDPQAVETGATIPIQAELTSSEPADSFLFNWSLDDKLVPDASSVGAQKFDAPITARAGGQQAVKVDVYRVSDSALIGSATSTLTVNGPTVSLSITPSQPGLGQQVVAQASADHFASATLLYTFTLDGAVVEATGPITQLPALSQGEHSLSVLVRSIEPPAESATANASFTVAGSQISLIAPSNGNTPLASLAARATGPVVAVAAVIGLGAVLALLVRFRQNNVLTS